MLLFTNIVSILSTDFVKLICIAFLIAAPLAWWATYKWFAGVLHTVTNNELVAVCISWLVHVIACFTNVKHTNSTSCIGEPCKEFANGMILMMNDK